MFKILLSIAVFVACAYAGEVPEWLTQSFSVSVMAFAVGAIITAACVINGGSSSRNTSFVVVVTSVISLIGYCAAIILAALAVALNIMQ